MKNKFHIATHLLLIAAYFSVNPVHATEISIWQESPVGKCYDSIDEYLTRSFGEQYKNDDNIKTYKIKQSNKKNNRNTDEYIWTMDTTPTTNITRTLFRLNKSGTACAILYVPASSTVSFKLGPRGELPALVTSEDSPPPYFPTNRITYKFNVLDGTYVPFECMKITPKNKKIKVSCDRAFQE